jgi:hypothetical protein
MALIDLRRNPTLRDLRWFGLILMAFLGLVGLLVWRATGSLSWPRVIWGVGVLAAAAYYLVERLRRPMFIGWSYLTYPIGWAVSHVLMALVFFGLFTAAGLLMRLVRYDPMTRTFDRAATTYWVRRNESADAPDYFRQY